MSIPPRAVALVLTALSATLTTGAGTAAADNDPADVVYETRSLAATDDSQATSRSAFLADGFFQAPRR